MQTARRTVPVRTCVGCRQRDRRADLLRVVAVSGRVVPDPGRRVPGRGASVHLDPRCVSLALRRGALPRALRVSGPLDTEELLAYVSGAERRAGRGSGESRQGGKPE